MYPLKVFLIGKMWNSVNVGESDIVESGTLLKRELPAWMKIRQPFC
jgi:hypothetical protein